MGAVAPTLSLHCFLFADVKTRLASTNQSKDAEISVLQEKLRMREAEISSMREEDAQRTNLLQSAVQSYVTRSPYKTT